MIEYSEKQIDAVKRLLYFQRGVVERIESFITEDMLRNTVTNDEVQKFHDSLGHFMEEQFSKIKMDQ